MEQVNSSYVIVIGALDADAAKRALNSAMDPEECSAKVLTPELQSEMLYERSDLPSGELLRGFASGRFRSLHFQSNISTPGSVLLFSPDFAGDGRWWWTLLLEHAAQNPLPLVRHLCSLPHMLFVALFAEDYLVDMPVPFSAEVFPWGSPWLVTATVFNPDGMVTTRNGEAYGLLWDEP